MRAVTKLMWIKFFSACKYDLNTNIDRRIDSIVSTHTETVLKFVPECNEANECYD